MLLPVLLLACTPTTPSPWSLTEEAPGQAVLSLAHLPEPVTVRAAVGRVDRGVLQDPEPLAVLGLDRFRDPRDRAGVAPGTWFRTVGERLQQGFELDRRPPGRGPLALDVELGIDGVPHRTPHGITFLDGRQVVATYNHLEAWDARGDTLPTEMQLRCDADEACVVRLAVDDADAVYPVTVDPYLTMGVVPSEVGPIPEAYRDKVIIESLAYGRQLFDATEDVPVPVFTFDPLVNPMRGAWTDEQLVFPEGTDTLLVHRFDAALNTYVLDREMDLEEDGVGLRVGAFAVEIGPMGMVVHGISGDAAATIRLYSDVSGAWEMVASVDVDTELKPAAANLNGWIGRDHWVGESAFVLPKADRDGAMRWVLDGEELVLDAEWTVDAPTIPYRLPAHTAGGLEVWGGTNDAVVIDVLGDPADPDFQRELGDFTEHGNHLLPSPSGRWLIESNDYSGPPSAPRLVNVLRMGADRNVAVYESLAGPRYASINWGTYATFVREDRFMVSDTLGHILPNEEGFTYFYTLNGAPLLLLETARLDEGGTLVLDSGTVLVADPDTPDDALTLTVATLPEWGTLYFDGAALVEGDEVPVDLAEAFTYVHDGSETTQDAFSLDACADDGQCSPTRTLQLRMRPVNDPPTVADDTLTLLEGDTAVLDALANDIDVDSPLDPLGLSVQAPSHGTTEALLSGIRYTHDGSEGPTDAFVYTLCDGDGACSDAAVQVEVIPVNDPPTAQDDAVSLDEGATLRIEVLANDADPDDVLDGSALSVRSGPFHGAVTILADGALEYRHDGSETLSDVVAYTVCDGAGACAEATVFVTVWPVNDLPLAVDDRASLPEGGTVQVPVFANDSDAEGPLDLSAATVVQAPAAGTVLLDASGALYTHDGSEGASDGFVYAVCDAEGACSEAAVSLAVEPVDDRPVVADDAVTLAEGGEARVEPLANDVDVDSELTVAVQQAGAHTAASVDGAAVVLRHDGSETASDTVLLSVCDGSGCVPSTLAVTITPVDDAPVAVDDVYAVQDVLVVDRAEGVLANDSDADSATLQATVVEGPAHGSLALDPDGGFVFTPDADFPGVDAFTYAAEDGTSRAVATVRLGGAAAPGIEEGEAGGCGCASGGSAGGWALLLGLAGMVRRRR